MKPTRARKAQYVIGIDLSTIEQAKLRKFVGAMGYPSVRMFVKEAIKGEMEAVLNYMPKEKRKAIEHIMGGPFE